MLTSKGRSGRDDAGGLCDAALHSSGGSRDGLNEAGVNDNEGAESSIAVVNSLITLIAAQK